MTRSRAGRTTGHSGRTGLSGSELDTLGVAVGDANAVVHALTDSKDAGESVIVSLDP